jgi:N-methylhydantoinase A
MVANNRPADRFNFIGGDCMPLPATEQTQQKSRELRIGVDVGGTFTDLVAFDGDHLSVIKVPSTPPDFELGVIEAVGRATGQTIPAKVIHGSTVATNALLQRRGEPIAFITTEGFRDMLLIGRQNRPKLYALHVVRPEPVTPEENWFTVRERIDARGRVVTPLEESDIQSLVSQIQSRGLKHAAICLLFSFINPAHEQKLGEALRRAGIAVSLSYEVMPEFREYERASTTAINASLRSTVESYLTRLSAGLPACVRELRVIQSAGGTATVDEASSSAAKMVLSGPAGGVVGAAFVARLAGFSDVITYDMGGTSTDVAAVRDATPHWTTRTIIDGLPIALPMYDIHTVGAGGGSVAYRDLGGSLRVGPRSAGALPGPACYNRGGTDPTVTDANLLLGRILPDQFLGGAMRIEPELAKEAIARLAQEIDRDLTTTALGILRIAEANMAAAVRAVTSRRGLDPRHFSLLTFGGAGGLHACAIADHLDIPRVLVPPYCGALSALGMVVAPPSVDLSRTVIHLDLDDVRLVEEFAAVESDAESLLPGPATITRHADVRFRGQSHEIAVPVEEISLSSIRQNFESAYATLYGRVPQNRPVELVALRIRRTAPAPQVHLPSITTGPSLRRPISLLDSTGHSHNAIALTRRDVRDMGTALGPALVIDPEATTYLPPHWTATARDDGTLILRRSSHAG